MDNFSISILDLLLLIVTGFFGFRSLFKGIVKTIFSFLGISAAYLAATLYYQPVTIRLEPLLGSPPWLNLVGFSLLFIAVLIAFSLIETTVLRLVAPRDAKAGDLASLLAFLIGLLEGFLFCSAILWVLQHKDLPNSKAIFTNSIFAPYYLNYNPLLFGLESRLRPDIFG